MRPRKYKKKAHNHELERRVRTIDELAAFDEFRDTLLPALMADLRAGRTDDEMLEKYRAIATARVVSEMILPGGQGLAAAKDILDRSRGKATEKKQIDHRYGRLDEKQIDALLLTQMKELTTAAADDDEE